MDDIAAREAQVRKLEVGTEELRAELAEAFADRNKWREQARKTLERNAELNRPNAKLADELIKARTEIEREKRKTKQALDNMDEAYVGLREARAMCSKLAKALKEVVGSEAELFGDSVAAALAEYRAWSKPTEHDEIMNEISDKWGSSE